MSNEHSIKGERTMLDTLLDVASPATLASLITDIDSIGSMDAEESRMRNSAWSELLRNVGAEEAFRLLDEVRDKRGIKQQKGHTMHEDSEPAMTEDRDEYIRNRVRKSLELLTQDALYWSDTPPACGEVEPLWYELRDTVVSVLFDMDREQAELERYAGHVVRECL